MQRTPAQRAWAREVGLGRAAASHRCWAASLVLIGLAFNVRVSGELAYAAVGEGRPVAHSTNWPLPGTRAAA